MAIAFAIYLFFRFRGLDPVAAPDSFWARYGVYALVAACVPALYYLRTFKRALDAWVAATRLPGGRDDALRMELIRRLSIGGAMCELPMALGVVQLLSGGEMRLFIGGAFFAVAMRLSYRPFVRS